MKTVTYAGQPVTLPDWPGDRLRGSDFMREHIDGYGSLCYGRASHNPKAAQGITDSADSQAGQYRAWCKRWKTRDRGIFLDPNSSAGITAARARVNFAQAMDKIRADRKVRVLWVMTSSRMGRGDIPYSVMMHTLQEHGVLLAIGDQLYNPAELQDYGDLHQRFAADVNATFAPRIASKNGRADALDEGRPVQRWPYGLVRDRDRRPAMDVPDTDHPEGQPALDPPASVVREIFRRVAAGDTLNGIARDLEARQVFTPRAAWCARARTPMPARPFAWTHVAVRHIAGSPVYIGKRRAGGEVREDIKANIEPLLAGEAGFWAAQRALGRRRGPGGGRQPPRNSMLANVALCGECGAPLTTSSSTRLRDGTPARVYACRARYHVAVSEKWLDEYVSKRIVAWLASEKTEDQLAGSPDEDDRAEAEEAGADADRIQAEIEKLVAGLRKPMGRYAAEADRNRIAALEPQLEDALARAERPGLDSEVAGFLGPDAGEKWHDASPARRGRLVSRVARVTVGRLPAGASPRWDPGVNAARVSVQWTMPDPKTGEPADGGLPAADAPASVTARQGRGERIAAWLADQPGPRTVAQIAAGLGEPVHNIQNVLRQPGAQVTRERIPGRGPGPNTWFYRAA